MQWYGVTYEMIRSMSASSTLPIFSCTLRWLTESEYGAAPPAPAPATEPVKGATCTVIDGSDWPLHWPTSPGFCASVVALSMRAHSVGRPAPPPISPLQTASHYTTTLSP